MKNLRRMTLGIVFVLVLTLAACTSIKPDVPRTSVTVENKGTYWQVVMDYASGKSHYELGRELGKAIIQAFPDFPAVVDAFWLAFLGNEPQFAGVFFQRLGSLEIEQKYVEEIEGIAAGLDVIDENLAGDGRLSRDELYILTYFVDITPIWQCSQIAVWGKNSKKGHTLIARNLDVMRGPTLRPMIAKLHSVVTVKNGKESFCNVGMLGNMGIFTAFKPNGLYLALNYSGLTKPKTYRDDPMPSIIVPSDYSRRASSMLFAARYAIENFSTMDEICAYMTSKVYHYNHCWLVADTKEAKVIENNFSGPKGWTGRQLVRDVKTELNPGVEPWVLDDSGTLDAYSIGLVNSFVAKGNYDNHTTHPHNYTRWHNQIEQLKKTLKLKGGKLELSDLVAIQTYFQGDKPASMAFGDLYNYDWRVYTGQVILFCPNTLELQIFFDTNEPQDGLPIHPIFEKVSPRF